MDASGSVRPPCGQGGPVHHLHRPASNLDQPTIGPVPRDPADDPAHASHVRCELLVCFSDDAIRIVLDQVPTSAIPKPNIAPPRIIAPHSRRGPVQLDRVRSRPLPDSRSWVPRMAMPVSKSHARAAGVVRVDGVLNGTERAEATVPRMAPSAKPSTARTRCAGRKSIIVPVTPNPDEPCQTHNVTSPFSAPGMVGERTPFALLRPGIVTPR